MVRQFNSMIEKIGLKQLEYGNCLIVYDNRIEIPQDKEETSF